MAPLLFLRAILAGRPIQVFNDGQMRRDFTYIEDIVSGVLAALDKPPTDDGMLPPCAVYNLGNHRPVELEHFIRVIEQAAGRPALKEYKPLQPGDMVQTSASIERVKDALGFEPTTTIDTALPQVVAWCRDYFGDKL